MITTIFFILILGILLSSCSNSPEGIHIINTQTALVLNFTQVAFDLSSTESAMYLKATQAEMNRSASEASRLTVTPLPSDTPSPPTSTPSNTLTQTSTSTMEYTPTETSTKTPTIPTYTSTPVKGMAKVRIENRTEYDIKVSLQCLQGPCLTHSPQSFRFVHPPGVSYIYIWDGKYQWKYTYCRDKYSEMIHTITTMWTFYMPAGRCKE